MSILVGLLFLASAVVASAVVEISDPVPEPCDPAKSLLDPITHRFRSNCDARHWCKPTSTFSSDPVLALPTVGVPWVIRDTFINSIAPPSPSPISQPVPLDFGLCVNKTCRRDEFPFGYRGVPFHQLPPLCSPDQFCPDDESQCQPLNGLGMPCQLNRDDSCEGWSVTHTSLSSALTVLCLQGTCQLASVELGGTCLLDRAEYLGYNESGSQTIAAVTRDNCRDGLYCEEATLQCQSEKADGIACIENRECLSFNCGLVTQTCEVAPQSVGQVATWIWCLIGFLIPLTLFIIVLSLYRLHLNHRALRSEEVDQFFSEQWQYRQAILSMHAAAKQATSHQSVPSSSKSDSLSNRQSYPPPRASPATSKRSEKKLTPSFNEDNAFASSLNIGRTSPTSPLDRSHATLSPRIPHNAHLRKMSS